MKVFYKSAFEKHATTFAELGVNANNGVGDVYSKIASLPAEKKAEIEADLAACYNERPDLAMVDSNNGITNLHVPSDVIIDASMPNVMRDSGSMWNKDDKLQECKAVIPDRSYAGIYQAMVEFIKANGQFDAATMGNVSNVGLMAQKAEEYGSHDKTFQMSAAGTVRVTQGSETVFEHTVGAGDIWRMCQAKDEPIKDWVKLAVNRARATGDTTIFWLNPERAHDRQLQVKVETYLKDHDITGLDISIKPPVEAISISMARCLENKNSISATGNVLRDYLTDLFPILELGTSAKMLSIVPMLAGGAMFETGAGGSAPKHVEQFVSENHLRWDSLGEYLAMGCSLLDLGEKTNNATAKRLGETLNKATSGYLTNNKVPGRKVGQPDNRTANFYIALYWAEAMAEVDSENFAALAKGLKDAEAQICEDLVKCQGVPVDAGGYYHPDSTKLTAAMCPSQAFNDLIELGKH